MGLAKCTYFYLHVTIDIFSRRVVGWCVADTESAALFKRLFASAVDNHAVPPGQLTLHADLGVTKSRSRPYTSDDNPFSESCFKTLKYQPLFPKHIGCIQGVKTFCQAFFDWCNQGH